ncbi:MAG: M24 family metallopeptidase [Rhodothermales bacterium]|nr:M24 family metallopeptidase [Rhodothermales bacterium]
MRLSCHLSLLICTLFLVSAAYGQADPPRVLTMEQRAETIDRWLEYRMETILPDLMRKHEIDMWIISAREYNEDPVIKTFLPATWLAARRRTILVLFDRGGDEGVEALAVARYDVGTKFTRAWTPEEQPDQWARLAEIVAERNPRKIAINRSELFATADGLTYSEYELMQSALDPALRKRLVSSELLAAAWLETRTDEEMKVYPRIVRMAHHIIAQGFSDTIVQPGITSTDDLEWWYRERIRELKLITWFHPSVSIQREGSGRDGDFSGRQDANIIQPGDLLHVDFGITYLRLNTDTQQHAYVLKSGETNAPDGILKALGVGNRLQDILTGNFVDGRSGNQILLASLEQASSEGINATIYTHPIGYHGHGTGPTIGLWDQQGGVPGRGDYPLNPNTAHSIELNARVPIPEWNDQEIRIMLEEDAFFDGESVLYIDGRQKQIILIPEPSAINSQ